MKSMKTLKMITIRKITTLRMKKREALRKYGERNFVRMSLRKMKNVSQTI